MAVNHNGSESYSSRRDEEKRKENEEFEERCNGFKETKAMMNLIKSSKKRGRKKDLNPEYKAEFEYLDSRIDQIEDLIVLCVPPIKIAQKMSDEWFAISNYYKNGIRPTIFLKWLEETVYVERIKAAERYSAEVQMTLGVEFMKEWLNKPILNMQHVGIVREIGLWHSRQAGFLNQKKYGKKIELSDGAPAAKVISGHDLEKFLEGITDAADKINNKKQEDEEEGIVDEEAGGSDGENSDFEDIDYEEA